MPRGPFFSNRSGSNFFSGDVRETLQREMNRVFDEIWRNLPDGEGSPASASTGASSTSTASTASKATTGAGALRVDVTETSTQVRVIADLPGVSEEDVDVTLDDDRLTIHAVRRSEHEGGGATAHTVERHAGVLIRTVTLPSAVDPEQVDARFDRGVLTVTLAKPRAAATGRKIPIRGAAATGAFNPGNGATGASSTDASLAGGATGGTPESGSLTCGAGGSAEGAGGFGFIQGDGALGASPSTGAGAEPATDVENASKPGGAIHGYNE